MRSTRLGKLLKPRASESGCTGQDMERRDGERRAVSGRPAAPRLSPRTLSAKQADRRLPATAPTPRN